MIPSYPLVFPIGFIFKFHHPIHPQTCRKRHHPKRIITVRSWTSKGKFCSSNSSPNSPWMSHTNCSGAFRTGSCLANRRGKENSLGIPKKCEISDYIMYPIMWLYVIMSYVLCILFWYWYTQYFLLGIRESDIPCKKHLLQPAGCSFQSSPNDSNLNLPRFCIITLVIVVCTVYTDHVFTKKPQDRETMTCSIIILLNYQISIKGDTNPLYNKIAEHLQDSETCLLIWWFMSCEPQKYVFLNQVVSPTANDSSQWTLINFQAGDGDMEPHTGPSGTTPELRQQHRTTWEPAHQNLQNHRNPHRTHIGTSGCTGTSGSSRNQSGTGTGSRRVLYLCWDPWASAVSKHL